MRLECVEAFADATVRVLSATLSGKCGRGPLRLADAEECREGIAVQVRFSGDLSGHVVLNVDLPAALRLYHAVTGERGDEATAIVQDYFFELGNLIAGGAVSALNELGLRVGVHPPQLPPSAGPDASATESCQIPVYSPLGTIMVQVVQRTW